MYLRCRNDGFFYFYFVVAVAAACVASQTMISAAFSVVKQSMMLNCFPRMRVIYTNVKVGRLLRVLPLPSAPELVLGTPAQTIHSS